MKTWSQCCDQITKEGYNYMVDPWTYFEKVSELYAREKVQLAMFILKSNAVVGVYNPGGEPIKVGINYKVTDKEILKQLNLNPKQDGKESKEESQDSEV